MSTWTTPSMDSTMAPVSTLESRISRMATAAPVASRTKHTVTANRRTTTSVTGRLVTAGVHAGAHRDGLQEVLERVQGVQQFHHPVGDVFRGGQGEVR